MQQNKNEFEKLQWRKRCNREDQWREVLRAPKINRDRDANWRGGRLSIIWRLGELW